MRSADGGQPGRKTSTWTTRWTGRAVGNSAGTTSSGMPGLSVDVLEVGALQQRPDPIGLRIAGTLAVTAQSPNEISVRVRSRTSRILWRSSSRRDGALDQAEVDRVRVLLHVDERAVDDVGALGDLEQALVHVEERHVAARAAVEPDRGEGGLGHVGLVLAEHAEVRQERTSLLAALGDRSALLEQRARGAHLDALAAARARRRLAPRRAHVGHDAFVDARAHDAPRVGALDLAADPHAAHAHDAAVVVDREERVAARRCRPWD